MRSARKHKSVIGFAMAVVAAVGVATVVTPAQAVSPPKIAAAQAVNPTKILEIKSENGGDGWCMTTNDDRSAGKASMAPCKGDNHQRWRVVRWSLPDGSKPVKFQNITTNLCLDVYKNRSEWRAYTNKCNHGRYQNWDDQNNGGDIQAEYRVTRLANQGTGGCLSSPYDLLNIPGLKNFLYVESCPAHVQGNDERYWYSERPVS